MFVLESMIRILTKLSMCLPASIKFPKFKHHELDRIGISVELVMLKLGEFAQQTEQQREIRIKEKTLSIPSHPEIIAPYSNNADRYAFPKQKKRERNKKRMQNCEKDAISV